MKVTGTGIVAPGAGPPEEILADGRRLLVRRAALPASLSPHHAGRLPRPARLALAACEEALAGAPTEGMGVALGSGFGSVEATRLALEGLFERADLVSPRHFVASMRDEAAGAVARSLSLRGPSVATSARRLSFEQALGWALLQLRRRRAPSLLVVGTDEVTPLLARSLARGRLCRERIVWGEGAGALLLEEDGSPRPALARIERLVEGSGTVSDLIAAVRRAFGSSFDAVFTDEDGGARRAKDARLVAEAFGCEKVATAETTGHLAAGGALAAALAVRSGLGRVLAYARETDGPFAAYVLERP